MSTMTIQQLNATLVRYAAISKLTPAEVLAKQGLKLGRFLRGNLAKLKPEKGSIRASRIAAINAGGGVKVRASARKFARARTIATASNLRTKEDALFMERTKAGNVKRNGRTFWQIAVARELSIRESGRGYLSLAGQMRYVDKAIISGSTFRVVNRINKEVGRAGMSITADGAALKFTYDNPDITEGLDRTKSKAAITTAMAETQADILKYVLPRELKAAQKKAGLN